MTSFSLEMWLEKSMISFGGTLLIGILKLARHISTTGDDSASSMAQTPCPLSLKNYGRHCHTENKLLLLPPGLPLAFLRILYRSKDFRSLLRGIRNVRVEYSVEPAKRISSSAVAATDVLEYISKEKQVLSLLSKLDVQSVHFSELPPGDANQSVHIVADEGLESYLPLADMVDVSEEVKRLSKRLSKMQSEYDSLLARLNSGSFVEKAPEEIVRGVREKASEAEEKISFTKNRLAFLQSTVSS